jgi:Ser/Thr protein kinase RdoA (MazF antagonist)
MENNILIMKNNIAPLLSHYDLGDFLNLSWADGGFTNENYFVETSAGKFFLKKYLRAGGERVNREHRLLEYLRNQHFPVPRLIKNTAGQTLTEMDDGFYAFFEFIPGHTRVATNSVTLTELQNTAKTLANYHYLAKNMPLQLEPLVPIFNKNSLNILYNEVVTILRNRKELDAFDSEINKVLAHKIKELNDLEEMDEAALPSLFTHGDFHAANLKFNEAGEILAVFDWELAKHQPRIWEVLLAMMFCAKTEWTWNFHTPVNFDRAKLFLENYNRVNPFSKTEIDAIPYLLKVASADLTWPLKEHYILNNLGSDRFLPRETGHWFFWNDENIKKLQEIVRGIAYSQPKLI